MKNAMNSIFHLQGDISYLHESNKYPLLTRSIAGWLTICCANSKHLLSANKNVIFHILVFKEGRFLDLPSLGNDQARLFAGRALSTFLGTVPSNLFYTNKLQGDCPHSFFSVFGLKMGVLAGTLC